MKSKIKIASLLLLKLLFLFVAGYILISKIEVDDVFVLISEVKISYFILALCASHISLLVSAYRSRLYLRFYKLELAYPKVLINYYTGMLFNVILPGGVSGDGYRALALHKQHKFSLKTTARVILYERVNGFYALCALGFISFYFTLFVNDLQMFIANTLLLTLVTPCYLWGNKVVLRDKNKYAVSLIRYSVLVQILQVVSFVLLVISMGGERYMYEFIFLLISASILSILPISIGGIGIRELTMLFGLSYLSLSNEIVELGVSIGLLNFIIYLLTAIGGIPSFYMTFSKRT